MGKIPFFTGNFPFLLSNNNFNIEPEYFESFIKISKIKIFMQPISTAAIMKMKQEYEQTLRKLSTESLKQRFPDRPWIEEVQSAWVSKKELLALLEDNSANGLRIHYGCHNESTSQDPTADYLGLHNVILVATIDSVNPDNPTTENSLDQLKDDNISKAESNTGSYTGSGGDALPTCPPTC